MGVRTFYSGFNFGMQLNRTVKQIIIVNLFVFLLYHLIPALPWLSVFALVPSLVFGKFRLWQFITYMFLHIDLLHLALNMLGLWFLAPAIESRWGRKQFLFYYFFTGIGAGVCSFLLSFNSSVTVIGASGAIFGLLIAYAKMFPDSIILLFFLFPIKIKHAVVFFIGYTLLGIIVTPDNGIVYCAHLGGMLFGYIYLRSEWLRRQASYFNFSELKLNLKRKKRRINFPSGEELDDQVDIILDKVSKYGIGSLNAKERKILDIKGRRINK